MRLGTHTLAASATCVALPLALPLVLATALDASVSQHYSTWMAASIMSRQQGLMTGAGGSSELLQAGITQKALSALVAQYADPLAGGGAGSAETLAMAKYVAASAASVAPFVANATRDALADPLDRLSNGNAALALYAEAGDDDGAATTTYGDMATALRRSIDLGPRTPAGGLWYYTYPDWSYLDGMYSLAPFYTAYTLAQAPWGYGSTTNTTDVQHQHHHGLEPLQLNATALDDMLLQLDLLWQHCRNASTGLLVHGYDASRTAVWADPATGASPHVWGRSLGWFSMALVDTLELLEPPVAATTTTTKASRNRNGNDDDGLGKYRARLQTMFGAVARAVLAAADPATGAWWQVMDAPGRAGNYVESSATAMFAYALAKGARLGYLGSGNASMPFQSAAAVAHGYLTDKFVVRNANGTLGWNGTVAVCSLNSSATYEYYVSQPLLYNSVLGSGAYVLASLEIERM